MKTEAEIQRAHDLLHALLMQPEALEVRLHAQEIPVVSASLDVLCWMLGHDNTNFADNLLKLEAFLFGKGIELVDTGKLNHPDG